jgi:hypothetical protein
MESVELVVAMFLLCFTSILLGWEMRTLYDMGCRERARQRKRKGRI